MVVFWEEHQREAEVRSIQLVVADTIALHLASKVTTGKQDSVMICRQQGSRREGDRLWRITLVTLSI